VQAIEGRSAAAAWKMKAPRIKQILDRVHAERGETSLEHLRRAPTERIKRNCASCRASAPKTNRLRAAVHLKRPDSRLTRTFIAIAQRLGWIVAKTFAERTYRILNALVPELLTYELHVLLITLGRRVSERRGPRASSVRCGCRAHTPASCARRLAKGSGNWSSCRFVPFIRGTATSVAGVRDVRPSDTWQGETDTCSV